MQDFVNLKNVIAVVGVSRDKNKWGYRVYKKLVDSGFKVFGVNPNCEKIDNKKCYPNLASLPKKPDVVSVVVPSKVTEKVVDQIVKMGIKMIWMQPGSESKKAIEKCKKNGIAVIYDACIVGDGLRQEFD